jgi:hypothetical protein
VRDARGPLGRRLNDLRAGDVERKTRKMMQRDLEAARKVWIKEAQSEQEKQEREKTWGRLHEDPVL